VAQSITSQSIGIRNLLTQNFLLKMFGSRKKKTDSPKNTMNQMLSSKKVNGDNMATSNRIGQGTKIEGEIITDGTIRIEGEIDGYIESKARVIIGDTGVVTGDIVCECIDISGRVTGKVICKDILFLKASAIVDGEIITNKLIMESGATFNGNCKTQSTSTVSPSSYSSEEGVSKKAV